MEKNLVKTAETGRQIGVADVLPVMERNLAAALGAVTVSHAHGLPVPVR